MDKSDWDAITAVSTAGAAVFTAAMALFTRKAVEDGQTQRREANRQFEETRNREKQHHQDEFRPLLVLVPTGYGDPNQRNEIVMVTSSSVINPAVYVKCSLHNIGAGPAINVKLSVRADERAGFGPSCELAPVAANETFAGKDDQLRVPVNYTETFNKEDLQQLRSGLWSLALEYEDLFGNAFYTLHKKNTNIVWTQVGRGAAPNA